VRGEISLKLLNVDFDLLVMNVEGSDVLSHRSLVYVTSICMYSSVSLQQITFQRSKGIYTVQ
jgi:hypothetical protein